MVLSAKVFGTLCEVHAPRGHVLGESPVPTASVIRLVADSQVYLDPEPNTIRWALGVFDVEIKRWHTVAVHREGKIAV